MTAVLRKFFADRGTHLAAMVAYFALLSFVPLLFLSLALLGAVGQASADSFFVRELHRTFPSTSIGSLIDAVQKIRENATALGVIGGAFLLWSSLSLFSVLESAFNIVYGRPNRPFLRGKARALLLMVGSLVFLFAALVVGSIGAELLRRYGGLSNNPVIANVISIGASLLGIFVFLTSAYVVLTNAKVTLREVLPGSVFAAIILETTFQFLPAFVRLLKHNPVVQTLSGPAVLLVWLYVMANVIVIGAEVNWHLRHVRREAAPVRRARGASARASTRRRARRPFRRARSG